jgi:uncharacterized membrane protein YbhN (UPF0104 family)
LVWLTPRPRTVGYANWKLVLPTVRLTLVQTGIGAMDLCLVTAAMYAVLPPNPAVDFVPVLVIFVTATLLGTVSHMPGASASSKRRSSSGCRNFPKKGCSRRC